MKITTLKFLKILSIFAISFLFSQQMYSQLDAQLSLDDAFARGEFIEIGINQKGTFGVPNAQHPGAPYHVGRETANDLFGFIANPLMDGWIDYDGDFFTPGSPEEGFAMEINGIAYNNNLTGAADIPGAISGANILTDPCFGDFANINWNGFIDGIEIIRDFSVSENGLFIRMQTTLTNLSGDMKSDVYWMHNVDPDNNQTINGSFTTDQEIIAQVSGPTDIFGFVCASQGPLGGVDANGSSVCYWVQDERARVTFGGFANRDPSDIWNGVGFVQTEGATNTADEAISIAFFFGDMAPAESFTFTYFYVFRDFTGSGVDPTFITLVGQDTSDCGLSDGSIVINGLLPSIDYDITYVDDGVPVGPVTIPADASGQLIIGGLDAGTYTDFVLTNVAGCFFENPGPIVISDPGAPAFGVTVNQPVNCDNDGSIILTGLDPSTDYTLTYTQDGTVIGPTAITSDAAGTFTISGLGEVTITDIIIDIGSGGGGADCSFTQPGPYFLAYPALNLLVTTQDLIICDSDGVLIISGLNPGVEYQVTYTVDGTVVGPAPFTSDGAGDITISGLDAGTYTDIIVVLNECTYTVPGPYDILFPVLDFTIIGVNPTTCTATGEIIISGLIASQDYDISYTLDGVVTGPFTLTTDAGGTITISGLDEGVYTDITVTLNDCSFTDSVTITLTYPPSPDFTVTAIDSEFCGSDGALLIEGLDPSTTYNITYTYDGSVVGPASFTTDASGAILISSLDLGDYTDIIVQDLVTLCETTLSGPFTIESLDVLTFTVSTLDPSTCSPDGSLIISGLDASTDYDVTYTYNGTVVGPATFTSDGSGTITISGLDEGTYTDITVTFLSCVTTLPGPFVIMYPASPDANEPDAYELCGDDSGTASFDLTSIDDEITGGASGVTVTYHSSIEDASSGDNPISSPYTNTTNPELLYVRVQDDFTGCYSTTTLELIVLANPVLTAPADVEECNEGATSQLVNQFDLTEYNNQLGIDLSEYTISYHTTLVDAQDGTNAILIPENYSNVSSPETIYIRATNSLGCFGVTQFNISVILCEIFIPEGISPNGDGFNDSFDIGGIGIHPNFILKIFDRRGILMYDGNNSDAPWDGTADEQNGELLPVGTYFYTLQLNDNTSDSTFNMIEQLYSGWVYLNY